MDVFPHLHVASGYSLRHGACLPEVLVTRAADHGMDVLALTDRDGTYGAVKFAVACSRAGIRPVLGVDLALHPEERPGTAGSPQRRTPVRGGAVVDLGLPRVTVLARGRRGWAALCRLVSAAHLSGERGRPVVTRELVARYAAEAAGDGDGAGLVVLLGPGSELGVLTGRRRPDQAREYLARWRAVLPPEALRVEVVCHRGPGEVARAARLLGLAEQEGLAAVLTNQVRYADRSDAPTADVLDAARRLVPLDARHVDRTNAEGYLKSGKEMAEVAAEVCRAAGSSDSDGARLLARTRALAESCALDVRADLGIGGVYFPELEVSDLTGRRLTGEPGEADAVLRERCLAGLGHRGVHLDRAGTERLDAELAVIQTLGYPTYFLTVADVSTLIRDLGVRCAARGSGAGSLVLYLLRVSDVDPLRYGLLMERFLSPLRHQLPDVDIDVESARRTEVYEKVLERYGGDRCACVAMMDTYRARHGIRDVGAALGLPPGEIDVIAKAFPHIRASQVRAALRDLPELRASGLSPERLDLMLRLVERLDGLPRHIAVHPCGVLLSDRTLLDRTPVESSWLGFPMSQFDKDDVEELGLLKLDLLGIRMQSAISHALVEVQRVEGETVDIDAVPRDDPATFSLVQAAKTLGCFQIESPGQRELIGKFAPETFDDLITDISLFRPGPVKSDMVRPFLEARQGWRQPSYLHPDLAPYLAPTGGVVVFHEQVLQIVAQLTGCSLAEADEVRRALGDPDGQPAAQAWFLPKALEAGYPGEVVDAAWEVLVAFGSFGFCKAHAAAFALPTYQSAWLKAHHPAAFLAGVLTHDPGMYPKRLILDDARQFGIAILGLDVNASDAEYRVERVGVLDEPPPEILDQVGAAARALAVRGATGYGATRPEEDPDLPPPPRQPPGPGLPDGRGYGIRLGLSEVKGITDAEVRRIVAGRPYHALSDFWHRAAPSRPVVERLVVAGAFDDLYGLSSSVPGRRRSRVTRRDLLIQVAELDVWSRSVARGRRARGGARSRAAAPLGTRPATVEDGLVDPRARARAQAQGTRSPVTGAVSPGGAAAGPPPEQVQLALDLGDAPDQVRPSGLPEMTDAELVRAELDVLGLDVSRHVVDFYEPFLAALGATRARDLLGCRSGQQVVVAGVKVATQTPPIRSGRRVVFVTLDDATGPVDATFFEDAQVGYATTLFHSWLLVIRGTVRRTGPRGVSLLAQGAWQLPELRTLWEAAGMDAVSHAMTGPQLGSLVPELAAVGAAASRSTRPVAVPPPTGSEAAGVGGGALLHPTGFLQSPYADIKPSGGDARSAPRRLWHSSPGSSGG